MANAQMVSGKTVTLIKDVSETDPYGRLLRYVFVGEDLFVNYELVKNGFAQVSTYPPDVACVDYYLNAQRIAKSSRLGIWGLSFPNPTATTSSTAPVCNCSGNINNCDDLSTHNEAQECFDYRISQGRGDIHKLDGDNNGSACESLP
jgi:micrococcal nuclease